LTYIEGTVLHIVYRNDENGYTVLEMDFNEELTAAVGSMPHIQPGEYVRLYGAWTDHKTFGRQFKVSGVETSLPKSMESIKLYLSSGLIKGVGEVTAGRIVEKFGQDTFRIIEHTPELLSGVKGVSAAAAKRISQSFVEHMGMQSLIIDLQNLGMTVKQAVKAFETYGAAAPDIIAQNPYRLIDDVRGIGFERADRIAEAIGIDRAAPFRLENGIKHVLKLALLEGHTCLPEAVLIEKAAQMLGIEENTLQNMADRLTLKEDIVKKIYNNTTAVFLSGAYYTESDAARRLYLLCKCPPKIEIRDIEKSYARAASLLILSEEQERAVFCALESTACVITGGPGTGKTTIINAILNVFEQNGVNTALCAPTGRAAKRMEGATGRAAKTIHRLLEYGNVNADDDFEYNGPDFMRNEDNPLEAEAVIVDEASMIDIYLFRSLLMALAQGTRLILVGDSDQLPSVGPGNVLKDVIESGLMSVMKLTHFYRQQGTGNIVENAHRVNRGEKVSLFGTGEFVFKHETEPEGVLAELKRLLKDGEIAQNYDILNDTQVLCPIKKGMLGVYNLNLELRELLNPLRINASEVMCVHTLFREGDKVMQTKNNYNKQWFVHNAVSYAQSGFGVFNGDLGRIIKIDHEEKQAMILFDGDRESFYDFNELEQIEHAYAITVHKSQGSEFAAVILPLFYGASPFLTRNLLYTALTRAKEKVVIVGLEKTLEHMVQNNRIQRRYTVLRREIRDIMEFFGKTE
jgi:exodeoxyribonuclease V alpha subunit